MLKIQTTKRYLKDFLIQDSGAKDGDALCVDDGLVTSAERPGHLLLTVHDDGDALLLHAESHAMPSVRRGCRGGQRFSKVFTSPVISYAVGPHYERRCSHIMRGHGASHICCMSQMGLSAGSSTLYFYLVQPSVGNVQCLGYTAAFQYFINFRGLSRLVGEMKGVRGNRKRSTNLLRET